MSAFAGFWVDGSVRKPEARHCDSDETVIAKWKRKSDGPTEFDICRLSFSKWDSVYWLDTTPRESLTPEEALSVIQMIYPQYTTIEKYEHNNWKFYGIDYHMPIEWGSLTQYPPPNQWLRVTRENVAYYLFQDCRFRGSDSQEWRNGKVAGWDEQDGTCLVNSDFNAHMPIARWRIVEVQNAN